MKHQETYMNCSNFAQGRWTESDNSLCISLVWMHCFESRILNYGDHLFYLGFNSLNLPLSVFTLPQYEIDSKLGSCVKETLRFT